MGTRSAPPTRWAHGGLFRGHTVERPMRPRLAGIGPQAPKAAKEAAGAHTASERAHQHISATVEGGQRARDEWPLVLCVMCLWPHKQCGRLATFAPCRIAHAFGPIQRLRCISSTPLGPWLRPPTSSALLGKTIGEAPRSSRGQADCNKLKAPKVTTSGVPPTPASKAKSETTDRLHWHLRFSSSRASRPLTALA